MISTQLLIDLGYKGAVIKLDEDWRSNRHIQLNDHKTLCGRPLVKQTMLYKDGRFLGYKPGSYTDVYGFYGTQRCKQCLVKYVQHRQSPKGIVMLKKAAALRLKQEWDRHLAVQQFRAEHTARLAAKKAQQQRARILLGLPQR